MAAAVDLTPGETRDVLAVSTAALHLEIRPERQTLPSPVHSTPGLPEGMGLLWFTDAAGVLRQVAVATGPTHGDLTVIEPTTHTAALIVRPGLRVVEEVI